MKTQQTILHQTVSQASMQKAINTFLQQCIDDERLTNKSQVKRLILDNYDYIADLAMCEEAKERGVLS